MKPEELDELRKKVKAVSKAIAKKRKKRKKAK